MFDKYLDWFLAMLISILVLVICVYLVALGYNAITGEWKERVIEVNNLEKRVVCFSTLGDKASSCYPYELLDLERVKKYEAKK